MANPSPIAPLTVLGIETSCDETAAAVVRLDESGVTILSDTIWSQTKEHAPYGGVVPEVAARAHVELIDRAIAEAMTKAGLTYAQLDGVAATAGPGLIGGVLVGLTAGKAIALAAGKPFVGINHLEGHALSARLAAQCDFPFLLLLVSGGHCQLLAVEGLGRYERYGATLDDAAGEAFDKAARVLGLGFPGGPALERAAADGDPNRFPLPRPLLDRPDCDFSFAGLKSAVVRLVETHGPLDAKGVSDAAAGVQAAIVDILADRAGRAMDRFAETHAAGGEMRFVVAGGVAANTAIRERLDAESRARGFRLIAPPIRHCTDNAAMIALAGAEHLRAGRTDPLDLEARARWPLDALAAGSAPLHAVGRKGAKA
jgi:N6-L-threonylcarbamoyladenine synthase